MNGVERRERKKIRTRNEILIAAEKVFADKGYHNTTIQEIAERAVLGKGTIYLYFKSKKDIFVSLIFDGVEKMNSAIKEIVNSDRNFEKKLEDMVYSLLKFSEENMDFFKIFSPENGDFQTILDKGLKMEITNRHRMNIILITKLINDGIAAGRLKNYNPRRTALVLIGIVQSFSTDRALSDRKDSLRLKANIIVELFLNGARSRLSG